ncbi:MAG TPA: hypothetical protein VGG39_22130 [Polyangiaceae bacterium]|jgi:hypothetical protein
MKATGVLPLLALVTIAAGVAVVAGTSACTNGTTPVCDDAGSCLLVPPSTGDGGQGDGEASEAGEAGEDGGTD